MRKINIFSYTILALGLITLISSSNPILSQDIYTISKKGSLTISGVGNKPITIYVPGGSFIGDPTFSLEELKLALSESPAGNCPTQETYNNFNKAYTRVVSSNKKLLSATLDYFHNLSSAGYCPNLLTTGLNKLSLRNLEGKLIK